MVNNFIKKSEDPESNYINYDLDVLKNLILKLKNKNVLPGCKKSFNSTGQHLLLKNFHNI